MFKYHWRSPVLVSLSSLVLLGTGSSQAFSRAPADTGSDPAPVIVQPVQAPVLQPATPQVPVLVAAPNDVVRIVSVNGTYNANHGSTINVQPGDMVTLSADLLDANNSYEAEGQPVEDFNWSANDSSSDYCSGQSQGDCLTDSNFQFTNYGVDFYVPYTMGETITISVSSTLGSDGTDSITLVNSSYQAPLPPVQIITTAEQYTGSTFDPEVAVNGQGRWVVIDNVRYWSPYTYQVDATEEWVPYRNGYWNWSDGYGYTWVSYDPWGWATDHYGVWRHHATYGWIWLPFDDRHYVPHAAAFFDNNGYIGWYPYTDQWADGYRQHDEVGFDDGFWEGYNVRQHWGEPSYTYHPGFSVCAYNDFRNQNVHDVIINRAYGFDSRVTVVVNENRFGRYPGQFTDYNESLTYVQTRCGGKLEIVETEQVRCAGGAEIYRPEAIHPVPTVYIQVAKSYDVTKRIPVGTVIGAGKITNDGPPRMMPPSSNGRGLSNPPRATDPKTGTINELPPRSQHPLAPAQGNPITTHQPVSAPVTRPEPPKVPAPVYHPPVQPQPVKPAPQPVKPEPQPVKPEPVKPEPQPVKPAPQPVKPAPQPVKPAPQPVKPAPQPVKPAPQPVKPAPQPVKPAPQPVKPAPQPVKPAPQPVKPAPQPVKPDPQPVKPAPQPVKPAPQPVRPAPQPARPAPQPARPAPQPARPAPQPQPARPAPQPQPARPAPEPTRPEPTPHR